MWGGGELEREVLRLDVTVMADLPLETNYLSKSRCGVEESVRKRGGVVVVLRLALVCCKISALTKHTSGLIGTCDFPRSPAGPKCERSTAVNQPAQQLF